MIVDVISRTEWHERTDTVLHDEAMFSLGLIRGSLFRGAGASARRNIS